MKKSPSHPLLAGAILVGVVAWCGAIDAAPVSITNGGFESSPATPPAPAYGPLTALNNPGGWVSSTGAGYNTGSLFVHSGSYGGYLDPSKSLTNVLSNTWTAGTYTLKGFAEPDRGGRANNLSVSLLSGSSVVATQTTLLNGSSRVYIPTTDVIVTVKPGDPIIGSQIKLAVNNVATSLDQAYVDDFSLDLDTSVPSTQPSDRWNAWRKAQTSFPTASWSYWSRYTASTSEYQIYANAGLNTVQAPLGSYFNARAAGLKAWIGSWEDIDLDQQKLASYISYPTQDHNGVTGYMLDDEPEPDRFATLAAATQTIYNTDTRNALPLVDLLPNYAWNSSSYRTTTWGSYRNYVVGYANTVKPAALLSDTYPTLADGTDRTDYYSNLELLREVSLSHGIGMMGFVLDAGLTPYRDPSESDMRWQVYSNIAYGAKGIWWYNYRIAPGGTDGYRSGLINDATGLPTAAYGYAQEMNGELQAIGKKLLSLQSVGVYHTGPTIPQDTTRFWQSGEPGNVSALNQVAGDDFLIGEFTNIDDSSDASRYLMLVNKRHGAGLLSTDPTIANQIAFTIDSGYRYVYEYLPSSGNLIQLDSIPQIVVNGVTLTNAYTMNFTGGQGYLVQLSAIPILGNYNGDGVVDAADYSVWRNSFGSTINLAADGNHDGVVDAADYVIWRNNLGTGVGMGAAVAVPEANAVPLIGIGLIAVAFLRIGRGA